MADPDADIAGLQAEVAQMRALFQTMQNDQQQNQNTIAGLMAVVNQNNTELTAHQNQLADANTQIAAQQAMITTLNAGAAAVAVPAPTAISFNVNPYAGNINPNSRTGERLFSTATKARDDSDRIKPNHQTAKQFLKMMEKDAGEYAWGNIISNIRSDAAGNTLDLLSDYQQLTLDQIRRSNRPIFQDRAALYGDALVDNQTAFEIDPAADAVTDLPIFHSRVRINMIGLRIIGSLTTKGFDSLNINKSQYIWTDAQGQSYYDGCVILFLILQHCNPSTRVGVSDLKQTIRACTLPKFNHNVTEMTNKMIECRNEIQARKFTHDDMVLDLFAALLTSKNEEFCQMIRSEKTKWELGAEDITADTLVTMAVTKYNNLDRQKLWSKSSEKDEKIVALTTKLEDLEKKVKSGKAGSSSGGGSGAGAGKASSYDKIAQWRLKKSFGDHIDSKDGKEWWWCTKHQDGKGLYVRHAPADHGKPYQPKGDSASSSSQKKTLTLNDNLKKAMVTKFKCTEAEAESLMSSLN